MTACHAVIGGLGVNRCRLSGSNCEALCGKTAQSSQRQTSAEDGVMESESLHQLTGFHTLFIPSEYTGYTFQLCHVP